MKTREIADAAGVSVDTVNRKIKDVYPELVERGKATNLRQDRAIRIMSELRKTGFVQPTQVAEVPTQVADVAAIVRETIQALLPAIVAAIRGGPTVATLPAPKALEPRADLRRLVAQGAKDGDYRAAWGRLYSQFFYRYGRNIKVCAKNRGMDTLDYAEDEDLMNDLLSLASEIFGS